MNSTIIKNEKKTIMQHYDHMSPAKRKELLAYAIYLDEKEEWKATLEVLEDEELMTGLQKGLKAEKEGKFEKIQL